MGAGDRRRRVSEWRDALDDVWGRGRGRGRGRSAGRTRGCGGAVTPAARHRVAGGWGAAAFSNQILRSIYDVLAESLRTRRKIEETEK